MYLRKLPTHFSEKTEEPYAALESAVSAGLDQRLPRVPRFSIHPTELA
jgi:hypothetical protein